MSTRQSFYSVPSTSYVFQDMNGRDSPYPFVNGDRGKYFSAVKRFNIQKILNLITIKEMILVICNFHTIAKLINTAITSTTREELAINKGNRKVIGMS